MILCQGRFLPAGACRGSGRSLFVGLLAAALLLSLVLAGPAAAQSFRCLDRITGDATASLEWSEGLWTQGPDTLFGCTTFAGGVTTPPGGPSIADSVVCSPGPDGWHWTVTIPGPFTLHYDFSGLPPGITICGQIFGLQSITDITEVSAAADLNADWLVITATGSGAELWSGRFSTFQPEQAGFIPLAAMRCGRYDPVALGACCDLDTGACYQLTEDECGQQGYPHQYLGDNVACDPNPCPQPTPAEGGTWGTIKNRYR
jgi:hypothetical protein